MQIRFVERQVALTDDALGEVLATHTVFRQLLGVSLHGEGRSETLWQAFVNGVAQQPDRVAWAYDFYMKQTTPALADEPG